MKKLFTLGYIVCLTCFHLWATRLGLLREEQQFSGSNSVCLLVWRLDFNHSGITVHCTLWGKSWSIFQIEFFRQLLTNCQSSVFIYFLLAVPEFSFTGSLKWITVKNSLPSLARRENFLEWVSECVANRWEISCSKLLQWAKKWGVFDRRLRTGEVCNWEIVPISEILALQSRPSPPPPPLGGM